MVYVLVNRLNIHVFEFLSYDTLVFNCKDIIPNTSESSLPLNSNSSLLLAASTTASSKACFSSSAA